MDHFYRGGGRHISDEIPTSQNDSKRSKTRKVLVILIIIILLSASLSTWYFFFRGPTDPYANYEPQVEGFFNSVDGIRTKGVINNQIGVREHPYMGGVNVDRLYVGGGVGDTFFPYGIYAYDRDNGKQEWAFHTENSLSSHIIALNFGSFTDYDDMETRIIFGCEDGTLYVLKDEFFSTRSEFPPFGDYVWSTGLNGAVSGIAVYKNGSLDYDYKDVIVVSTNTGYLYAFRGNDSHPVNSTLIWSLKVGDYELTQPVISSDGTYVYVGSNSGKLWGLMTSNGNAISGWNDGFVIPSHEWSTALVVTSNPPILYLSSDDGFILSINGIDGSERQGWEGGLEVKNSKGKVDGGKLTLPLISNDGRVLYFGSSTGHVYTYGSDGILIRDFDTTFNGALETECTVTPLYDEDNTEFLFFTVTCTNNTPNIRGDDYTHLYSIDQDFNVSFRLTLDGIVLNSPVAFLGSRVHLNGGDVVIVTVIVDDAGAMSAGCIYCFVHSGWMVPKE